MSHVSTTPPTMGSSLLSARHSFSCETCPLGWCTSTENAGTLRITNTTTAANQPCAMSATVSVTNDTRQPTEDGVTCKKVMSKGAAAEEALNFKFEFVHSIRCSVGIDMSPPPLSF
jgi:hypothetical protein